MSNFRGALLCIYPFLIIVIGVYYYNQSVVKNVDDIVAQSRLGQSYLNSAKPSEGCRKERKYLSMMIDTEATIFKWFDTQIVVLLFLLVFTSFLLPIVVYLEMKRHEQS